MLSYDICHKYYHKDIWDDGDTTSEKMVFSLEANKEAQEIAESVKSFVAPDGSSLRVIKNESYLTFFNMTNPD